MPRSYLWEFLFLVHRVLEKQKVHAPVPYSSRIVWWNVREEISLTSIDGNRAKTIQVLENIFLFNCQPNCLIRRPKHTIRQCSWLLRLYVFGRWDWQLAFARDREREREWEKPNCPKAQYANHGVDIGDWISFLKNLELNLDCHLSQIWSLYWYHFTALV